MLEIKRQKTDVLIIGSGGAGLRNDTSVNTTGDGYTLALDAGASLRDMEIVQFEPYVQAEPDLPMMDRHESEAEFHGVLKNALDEDFLPKYLPTVKTRLEALNLARASRVIAGAALRRTESRGAHFRTDFPKRDDGRWLVNQFVRQEGRELHYSERPIKLRTTELLKQSKFGIEVK